MKIVREIIAIAVTIVYIAGAYVGVSPSGAVVYGIAGGFIAHRVLRPDLFDEVIDENSIPFSPSSKRVILTMGLLGGLVGFGGVAIASFI